MKRIHCDICDAVIDNSQQGRSGRVFRMPTGIDLAICADCLISEPAKALSLLLNEIPHEIKP